MDNGYGRLWADLWGIADLHCRKVESTKWLKHKVSYARRPIVGTNQWHSWVSFSFEVRQGMAGICHAGLWGSPEAL